MTLTRFSVAFFAISAALSAHAGVFETPRFVQPDQMAIGVEPELTLTGGAGLGVNLKYRHGINDLINAAGIIGTGSGPRQFRVGGQVIFDFFPDIEGQPGIGVAGQALYYRLKNYGQLDLTAIPYIHKTFISNDNQFEPFLAVPFGVGVNSESDSPFLTTLAIGSIFKKGESLAFVVELGVSINRAYTYFSGGMAFYP